MPNAQAYFLKKKICWLFITFFVAAMLGCVTIEDPLFKSSATKEQAVERRVQVAVSYLRKNEIRIAIRHLEMALNIDAESPRVHEVLGIAFEQGGDLELAEEHYKKSLRLDDEYTRGRNNYASYLYRQARYQEALEEFEEVVKDVYYENRAPAFVNLGRVALKLSDMEKAELAFSRALSLDLKQVGGMIELAQIYYERNQFETAQRFFKKYRETVSQTSPKSLLLGIRLAHHFDDKNTIASYTMVLKNMYPESTEYQELKKIQATYEQSRN